ncbi:MAG: glycosyltransferase family 4 protein [Pyrinomonadaceae bacterium]
MKVIILIIHSFNISGVLTQSLILSRYLKSIGYDVLIIGKKGKYGETIFRKHGFKTFRLSSKLIDHIQNSNFYSSLDSNVKMIICESIFSYSTFIKIFPFFPKSTTLLRVHEEINEGLLKRNLWQSESDVNIRQIFNQFQLILFPSTHTANFYSKEIGKNKFYVVPITINEDMPIKEYKRDKIFRILQLGTVYERKNPILTLIAFEIFLTDYSPNSAQLLFVGARGANPRERAYINELKSEIVKRKLDNKVRIIKTNISPEKYISRASLVTLHSVSECTPTVFLEANYLGIKVASANVGGISEIVKHGINGYLFEFGDCKAQAEIFGKAYLAFLHKESKSSHLSTYYLDNFSNSHFFNRIKEIFEEI